MAVCGSLPVESSCTKAEANILWELQIGGGDAAKAEDHNQANNGNHQLKYLRLFVTSLVFHSEVSMRWLV